MTQNQETLEVHQTQQKELLNTRVKGILDFLLLKPLINKFYSNPVRLIISLSVVLINAILCSVLNIQPVLFFFTPYNENASNTTLSDQILIAGSFCVEFLLLYGLTELLCRILFNKKENWKELFTLTGIPFIPTFFYLLLYLVIGFLPGYKLSVWNNVVMIIFQVWSMVLLASIISYTKFVKIERGFIIAIFIDYGTFMFLLLGQNSFI